MITKTDLKLNDYHWSVGDLRKEENKGFDIDVTETRVLPYKNRFQNAITYEMSMNRHEYTRTVYNILDFMRDMGGLFNALTLIFGTIIAILQYRGMYMTVTSLMLKTREIKLRES